MSDHLRFCDYCQSWHSKPCGDGCVRLPTLPMIEQGADLINALETIRQLVMTNRTHSVLDEVKSVCDKAIGERDVSAIATNQGDAA